MGRGRRVALRLGIGGDAGRPDTDFQFVRAARPGGVAALGTCLRGSLTDEGPAEADPYAVSCLWIAFCSATQRNFVPSCYGLS